MRSQNTIFTENGETDEESEKRSEKVTARNAFCKKDSPRINEVLILSTVFFNNTQTHICCSVFVSAL